MATILQRALTFTTIAFTAACAWSTPSELISREPSPAAKYCPYLADKFTKQLIEKIHGCVDYNNEITNKEEIHSLLKALENHKVVTQQGSNDLQIPFVTAQSCIEHVLSCSQTLGDISQIIGVIHTPMPATPLCTNLNDPGLGDLLDASIANDQDKLLTVRSRTQVVRDYLAKGGKLFVTYPKGGLEKRVPEQQRFYLEALDQYPDSLKDSVLSCDQMDPDMVGATYLFKHKNKWFAFSIKSRQANDIQNSAEWSIWFGRISHPEIKKRLIDVHTFLMTNNGPDLSGFILSK